MASTTSKRVAVVTGSNKGIGLAAVRALCKQFDGDVILTSRDVGRGQAAVKQLQQEGLKPEFQQLDIDDSASIKALGDFLQKKYGGLDVLVNNAGINHDNPLDDLVIAEKLMKTDFWAFVEICDVLFPLLRSNARVANVSSQGSNMFYNMCSAERQAQMEDPALTREKVDQMMKDFLSSALKGNCKADGWFASAYSAAKTGMRLYTRLQQKQFDNDKQGRTGILVNCCCPGFVDTDMSKVLQAPGKITPDQGAETPVMLALLPKGATSPKGEFLFEKKVAGWELNDLQKELLKMFQ